MSLSAEVDPILMRASGRVGITLRDKWRLDRLLGVGGMAAVYAGTHRNGSRGAIKMLHLELSLDADLKRRFLREGYVANTVDHPGVVRVIDDDVADDGSVFLVMELLSGETLDARWERCARRLSPEEVLSAMDSILAVLAAAHEKGIVHRDIKPENIFVCQDGSVKLLDFGIARLRESSVSATQSGSAMGTPSFMPPEQALGRSNDVGPRSDLWSVGATMYTLLTGELVHRGDTPNELLVAAAIRHASSLRERLPDAPASLVELVDKALAFDIPSRWESANAMREALASAYQTLAGSTLQSAPKLMVPDTRIVPPQSTTLSRATNETTTAATLGDRPIPTGIVPPRRSPVLSILGALFLFLGGVAATILVFDIGHTRTKSRELLGVASDAPAEGPTANASGTATGTAAATASDSASATPSDSSAPPSTPVTGLPDMGQIKVVVHGGNCVVSVDGTILNLGATDTFKFPVGPHMVTCKTTKGHVAKQSVRIVAGQIKTVSLSAR